MSDELLLSIEKLIYGGEGLAHADGEATVAWITVLVWLVIEYDVTFPEASWISTFETNPRLLPCMANPEPVKEPRCVSSVCVG